MSMLLALGTDHRGFMLKEFLKKQHDIKGLPVRWHDCGAFSSERTDYPRYALPVVNAILDNHVQYGILLCGSGAGMAIAANRHKKIYAAVAWNEKIARLIKEDDGCNILVLPADCMNEVAVLNTVHAWLTATFKNGRYAERLAMIDNF